MSHSKYREGTGFIRFASWVAIALVALCLYIMFTESRATLDFATAFMACIASSSAFAYNLSLYAHRHLFISNLQSTFGGRAFITGILWLFTNAIPLAYLLLNARDNFYALLCLGATSFSLFGFLSLFKRIFTFIGQSTYEAEKIQKLQIRIEELYKTLTTSPIKPNKDDKAMYRQGTNPKTVQEALKAKIYFEKRLLSVRYS